jgi:hypothetical protein
MSSCGCNKQGGGGSKRCSYKKCRRYSQRGGGIFDFFGSTPTTTTTTTPTTTTIPSPIEDKVCMTKQEYNQLTSNQSRVTDSEPLITAGEVRGGGGGGNMMARQNFGLRGGYGELVTSQDEATIGLDSGPSIATQGLVSQAGGKRRSRKTRKTRRMKKSRKHKKSRKYRR